MNIGLLWFDDDPKRDLPEKIIRAARRYRKKFGIPPNVCYVHKSAPGGNGQTAHLPAQAGLGQIRVETLPSVLLHHFWIGQEQQP